MHLEGQGLPKNPVKAFELIQRAAKKKNVDGQYNLGILYYNGWGTPLNLLKARELFSNAASQGHVVAIYHLAYMNLYGVAGIPASCSSALRLFKRVAERGEMNDLLLTAHDRYQDGLVDDALIRYEV
jgi:SEL1 protein